VHFSRFFPNYRLRNQPPTPAASLLRAAAIAAEAGHRFVYLGNLPGTEWSATRCPTGNEPLIARSGYVITGQQLQAGRCPVHGDTIPGIWQ